jgi:type VI secretion system secreted protein Hcp
MAVDMFLQIEGIPGDSTDSKHAKWIEILSYTHSIIQSSGGAASAQGTHAGGRADHSDFSVVKRLDSGSPVIAKYVCDAKPIPTITFELCRAMGEKTCFMKYILTDSIISSYRPSGHSQGEDMVPLEEISFRYGAIKFEYTPTDARTGGKTGAAIKSGWSTIENKPL